MAKEFIPSAYQQATAIPGIYKISCSVNGKNYFGSSINMRSRINCHTSALRRGVHANSHLQAAYSLYGESAFQVSVILICLPKDLLFYEQRVIDSYEKASLYNQRKEVSSNAGFRHSPETKKAMTESRTGRKHSASSIERMRERITSIETRQKISYKALHRQYSDAERLNYANSTARKSMYARNSKPYPSFTSPEKIIYPAGRNLSQFAKSVGVVSNGLKSVALGQYRQYKGWTLTGKLSN